MFIALGSNILFGIIITILGIVNSTFARSRLNISSYFVAGTTLALTVCTLLYVDFSKISDTPYLHETLLVIIFSSVFNNIGHLLSVSALQRGHNAAGWAIAQSAMIVPFLYGTIFAGGNWSALGFAGMGAVLCGIYMLALNRRKQPETSEKKPEGIDPIWLAMALGSLLCYGMAQTMMSIPSTWENFSDPAKIRAPLLMACSVLFQAGVLIIKRQKFERKVLKYSVFYGLFLIACNSLVFFVLDRMTSFQMGNIVWPIAIGVCIIGFSIYSTLKLHETFTRRDILGLCAIIAGLCLLALR